MRTLKQRLPAPTMLVVVGLCGCCTSPRARHEAASEPLPTGLHAWQQSFITKELAIVDHTRELVTVFVSARGWPTAEVIRRTLTTDGRRIQCELRLADREAHPPASPNSTLLYSSEQPEALQRFSELLECRAMLATAQPASLDALGQGTWIAVVHDGVPAWRNLDRSGPISVALPGYDPRFIQEAMADPYSNPAEQDADRQSAQTYIAHGLWRTDAVFGEMLVAFDAAMTCISSPPAIAPP